MVCSRCTRGGMGLKNPTACERFTRRGPAIACVTAVITIIACLIITKVLDHDTGAGESTAILVHVCRFLVCVFMCVRVFVPDCHGISHASYFRTSF